MSTKKQAPEKRAKISLLPDLKAPAQFSAMSWKSASSGMKTDPDLENRARSPETKPYIHN